MKGWCSVLVTCDSGKSVDGRVFGGLGGCMRVCEVKRVGGRMGAGWQK